MIVRPLACATIVAGFIGFAASSSTAMPLNIEMPSALIGQASDVIKIGSKKLRYKNGRRYNKKSRRKNRLSRRNLRKGESLELYGLQDDGHYRRLRDNYDLENDYNYRNSSSGDYFARTY